VDEFVSASKGKNEKFWSAIYNADPMGGGGAYVNGWINGFFPYLVDGPAGVATTPHYFLLTESRPLRNAVSCHGGQVAKSMLSDREHKSAPRQVRLDPLKGFVGAQSAATNDELLPERTVTRTVSLESIATGVRDGVPWRLC
jgi:hypothetical protein